MPMAGDNAPVPGLSAPTRAAHMSNPQVESKKREMDRLFAVRSREITLLTEVSDLSVRGEPGEAPVRERRDGVASEEEVAVRRDFLCPKFRSCN